jgi:hypothetical protein
MLKKFIVFKNVMVWRVSSINDNSIIVHLDFNKFHYHVHVVDFQIGVEQLSEALMFFERLPLSTRFCPQ